MPWNTKGIQNAEVHFKGDITWWIYSHLICVWIVHHQIQRESFREIMKTLNVVDCLDLLFLLIDVLTELIGVTLVHKTIQVSSERLDKTSWAHCIVSPLTKPESLSVPTYPASAHPPSTPFSLWLSPHCCLCLCYISLFVCLIPSPSLTQCPNPHSPLTAVSLFQDPGLYFVSLFCSLDTTYKWNRMVF